MQRLVRSPELAAKQKEVQVMTTCDCAASEDKFVGKPFSLWGLILTTSGQTN